MPKDDVAVERTVQEAEVEAGSSINERITKPNPIREPLVEFLVGAGGEFLGKGARPRMEMSPGPNHGPS